METIIALASFLSLVLITWGIKSLKTYLNTLITSIVSESIRNQFEVNRQKMREEFEREIHTTDRKDKFRLAAIDERLKAHQRAYALARKMNESIAQPIERANVEKECWLFWEEQSLYLSNDVRKKFSESFGFYRFYDDTLRIAQGSELASPDLHKKQFDEIDANWKKLWDLPSLIEKAVDLETIEITKSEVK